MIGYKLSDRSFLGTIPSMMKKVGLKLKSLSLSICKTRRLCPNSLIEFLAISMTLKGSYWCQIHFQPQQETKGQALPHP